MDFSKLDRLIEKYSVAGPRYTSYPTAVEFTENFASREWSAELRTDCLVRASAATNKSQNDTSGAYSLYVHIPFCPQLCYFCACNKIITKDIELHQPYIASLISELKMYREILGGDILFEQIHWGGGTPNSLSPENVAYLHEAVLEIFPNVTPDADISVEIDPRTTSVEHISALKRLGFTRVSLGVQDFNAVVQETVNRIQPFEMTAATIAEARRVGFQSVNIDLIYGLPNQTLEGFERTLEQVLEIRPDRIALYGYAHVTWIRKVQKALERAHLPTPAERIRLFLRALEAFEEAGYCYIGMDHFALPDDSLSTALKSERLNRNFMGYSSHRGARLLGVGVSAISSLPESFAQNTKDILEYQRSVGNGVLPTFRGLKRTEDDCRRGEIIESILCQGNLNIEKFEAFWKLDFFSLYPDTVPQLKQMAEDRLLNFDRKAIQLTAMGRVLSRNVAMIFDAYLSQHRASEKPKFSQAV